MQDKAPRPRSGRALGIFARPESARQRIPVLRIARVVVVSPHLDDGVFSLGAAITLWARRGARVELLTVLACDPESEAQTGGWDARAGFRTEGEAARARRDEDVRACAIVGATPVWLPFGSVDYERHGEDEAVRAAVASAVDGADAVLLPGSPLSHPDHAWLTGVLVSGVSFRRLGFYAEQPYTRRGGSEPEADAWLEDALGGTLQFEPVPASSCHRLAKWRAIRKYRSQLPPLGMEWSLRRGPHSILWEEMVAWVGGRGRAPD
jgi:LmbE family N-acetylglucosaminyl deacetylase